MRVEKLLSFVMHFHHFHFWLQIRTLQQQWGVGNIVLCVRERVCLFDCSVMVCCGRFSYWKSWFLISKWLNFQTPLQRPISFHSDRWHAIAAQSCQSQQDSIQGAPFFFSAIIVPASFIHIRKCLNVVQQSLLQLAGEGYTLPSDIVLILRWSSTAIDSKR